MCSSLKGTYKFYLIRSLAGMCLVIQLLSGLFLTMHYTPNIALAFSSVEHIMRDGVGIVWFSALYPRNNEFI